MNAEVLAYSGAHLSPIYADVSQVIDHLAPTEPCYLFSAEALQAQAQQFIAGFPGLVTYAVKANCQPEVLNTLWRSGVHAFDVASIAEIALIHSLLPQATLHFNNPIRPDRDVRLAYEQYGIRSFAVDDLPTLEQLVQLIDAPEQVELSVRFAMTEGGSSNYDFASKFGADEATAAILLKRSHEAGFKSALSFHPGSQCTDPEAYRRHIAAAARIQATAGVSVERLNVGGGFSVPYLETEVAPLADYFVTIQQAVDEYFPQNPPALICEPGRAMVANCCHLLCQVTHVRPNGDVFINDGVYGGLMEQAFVDIDCPIRVWRKGDLLCGDDSEMRWIFGPTCDSVDRLSRQQKLPVDIAVGDWLEFRLMGAYASVTATRFNGFRSLQYVPVSELL